MLHSVGLVLNPHREEAVLCAGKAGKILESKGISVVDMQLQPQHAAPQLIMTFGGDGTLLSGARFAMQYDIPLLGINLGTVGFLTETEPAGLEKAVEALISSRYELESRCLLQVTHPASGETYYALNDAVISRGGYARLIRVDACVNDQEYGFFIADGIIVATPTGSTGYSLSAGGPIVAPGMNCMIITPICAHSMQHCSCVVSADSAIRLTLHAGRTQTAELQIDGISRGMLKASDEILVTGSDRKIRLIRLRPYDFFGLIHHKLSEWGS